jgi:hypothetical protein
MHKYDKKAKHYAAKAVKSHKLAMAASARGALGAYRRHMKSYARYSNAAKHYEELAEQSAHARTGGPYVSYPTKFRNESHRTASSRRERAIARNIQATRRLQAGNRGARKDGDQAFAYLIQ